VTTLEERDTGPDVDGLFVTAAEVLIETGQEQLLDASSAVGLARRPGMDSFSALRL
jgi:hypothetical protein